MCSTDGKLLPLVSSRTNASVRYKFTQSWPKDGEVPQQSLPPSEPVARLKPQRISSAADLYTKRSSESLWHVSGRRNSTRDECSSVSEAPVSRFSISRASSPFLHSNKRVLNRKQTRSRLLENQSGFRPSEAHRVEIYHLPPMLLPDIRKSKEVDFKAMKRNRPPSPPIDPYFFSPRSRRRRDASQAETFNRFQSRQSLLLTKNSTPLRERK